MKKKINYQLLLISGIAILMTLLLTVSVFYDLFRRQVMDDLKTNAHMLKNIDAEILEEYYELDEVTDKMRITIINPYGVVLTDSQANPDLMENHSDRTEIIEALKLGEGQTVRKSDTLKTNMYYYALVMKNGDIMRVSREAGSIWSLFSKALPSVLGLAILLFIICMIVANFFIKRLIKPIEDMALDLEGINIGDSYPELVPFINTIHKQHEDIIKSARMRQDFTANVSHELKTPLTSISGYSELIESGIVPEQEVRRFAKEIRKNSTRLLTLINDIIRLSELDEPEVTTQFENVNLYQITQTCVDMLQVNAENHQVSLTFWGEPCTVYSSKEMMEEVLYNLCDNAIRYNNVNGSVHVEVRCKDDNAILQVKDTGIGIPKKYQERVFERFYRVDKSRSKMTGGTGLGLAIVKHTVAQMHATLNLISEEGKGTTITVTFPKSR